MIQRFNKWREARARKLAINRIRMLAYGLGQDLSKLSDEDIEEGVNQAALAFSKCGWVSLETAEKAFRLIGSAFKDIT